MAVVRGIQKISRTEFHTHCPLFSDFVPIGIEILKDCYGSTTTKPSLNFIIFVNRCGISHLLKKF